MHREVYRPGGEGREREFRIADGEKARVGGTAEARWSGAPSAHGPKASHRCRDVRPQCACCRRGRKSRYDCQRGACENEWLAMCPACPLLKSAEAVSSIVTARSVSLDAPRLNLSGCRHSLLPTVSLPTRSPAISDGCKELFFWRKYCCIARTCCFLGITQPIRGLM